MPNYHQKYIIMKTHFKHAIMAVAAIATAAGLTGCSKENNGTVSVEERDAVLNIRLVNPAHTRVSGAASTSDHELKDVNIFVLDGNDNVYRKLWVPNTGSLTENTATLTVTTAAKAVYAIANAGQDLTATYTTKAALESTSPQADLDGQYTALWATGFTDGSLWTFQGTDRNGNGLLEQDVDLDLRFIAARITVKVNNNMSGYTGEAGTVRLGDVAVLNARGQSRLFEGSGTSLIPTTSITASKKFIEGLEKPEAPVVQFTYFPASTDYTVEEADVDHLNNPYPSTNPAFSYFYVFESDADELTEFPTIVTLVGLDTEDNPIYFPVHLAGYETWAANTQGYAGGVERGKSYDITINLTGNAAVGTGGGTKDPTVNVKDVDLNVAIEISDWTAVPLGKNF